MNNITTLIVDDEFHSRESLKSLITKYCPDLEVVALAASVREAYDMIVREAPQLVFLDIMMPDGNGFDVLEAFPERTFQAIFTTAYDNFAVKAFRFAALDYLLKPISIAMLKEAVSKYKKRKEGNSLSYDALGHFFKTQHFDKIIVPAQEGYHFINTNVIVAIEANSNYCILHRIDDKPFLASKTLLEFNEMLSDQSFFRIHHSCLINLQQVVSFNNKENVVTMSNGKEFIVSFRKKGGFIDICKALGQRKGLPGVENPMMNR